MLRRRRGTPGRLPTKKKRSGIFSALLPSYALGEEDTTSQRDGGDLCYGIATRSAKLRRKRVVRNLRGNVEVFWEGARRDKEKVAADHACRVASSGRPKKRTRRVRSGSSSRKEKKKEEKQREGKMNEKVQEGKKTPENGYSFLKNSAERGSFHTLKEKVVEEKSIRGNRSARVMVLRFADPDGGEEGCSRRKQKALQDCQRHVFTKGTKGTRIQA